MKPLTFIRAKWMGITLLMLAGITVFSLWPKEAPSLPGSDKLHHLLAYAALMFPAAFGKPARRLGFGCLFIAYSGLIEGLQPLVNRHGDWLDVAANAAGVGCGAILAALINSRHPDRDPQPEWKGNRVSDRRP